MSSHNNKILCQEIDNVLFQTNIKIKKPSNVMNVLGTESKTADNDTMNTKDTYQTVDFLMQEDI